MKATLNKKLHQRALDIIEIIEKAEKRIKYEEEKIKEYEPHFFYNVENCKKKIEGYKAAIERLEKSYQETIKRINKAK